MACINRVNECVVKGGDNFYVNVGIITLEDVIAQLLGKHEPEEAVQGSDPVLRQSKEFEQR